MEKGTAIVTGAAHGIGLATAERLAGAGYAVIAIDCDEHALKNSRLANNSRLVVHDVADEPYSMLESVLGPLGAPSVLVNNVGIMAGKSFLELDRSELENTFRTNIFGTWFLTKAVAERMVAERSGGSIIFNLSLHTTKIRMSPDYSSTKAALRMLVRELAWELGPYGIRVNSVSPGAIDTWSDRIEEAEEHRQRTEAMIPLRRVGAPVDVANAIAFLCSASEAGYLNGSDITVDGGLDQFNWLHHLYDDASDERQQTSTPSSSETI